MNSRYIYIDANHQISMCFFSTNKRQNDNLSFISIHHCLVHLECLYFFSHLISLTSFLFAYLYSLFNTYIFNHSSNIYTENLFVQCVYQIISMLFCEQYLCFENSHFIICASHSFYLFIMYLGIFSFFFFAYT
jgi:hypothetical protein